MTLFASMDFFDAALLTLSGTTAEFLLFPMLMIRIYIDDLRMCYSAKHTNTRLALKLINFH